jgi:NAD(P)-dependent dehydrogenase (short-subunit alcohol dehydrogenase family)
MSKTFRDNILAGKVAYIAGGTRGMNLEIAKRYAEHGAKVAVMSRNPERAAAAADEIRAIGGEALGFPCDVRDYDAVAATLKTTAEELGPIDIVVAGQAGNFYAPAIGMSANGFRTIIDIDLNGSFNVFRAAFEHLVKPGACCIAITAPEAVRPLHFQAHVCAAKAGLNMLLKVLAIEWGPAGIRVNGISPGPIEDSWGMKNVASPSEELVEKIRMAVPLRRWGTCDDIANIALFLVSDAASYINGTILDCDGGVTIASPEQGETDAVFDPSSDSRVKGAPGK